MSWWWLTLMDDTVQECCFYNILINNLKLVQYGVEEVWSHWSFLFKMNGVSFWQHDHSTWLHSSIMSPKSLTLLTLQQPRRERGWWEVNPTENMNEAREQQPIHKPGLPWRHLPQEMSPTKIKFWNGSSIQTGPQHLAQSAIRVNSSCWSITFVCSKCSGLSRPGISAVRTAQ